MRESTERALPPRPPIVVADRSGPWVPRMVETLQEFKRLGLEFDFAWRIALRQQPPKPVEIGGTRNGDAAAALDWFHGVCLNAWFDMPAPTGGPSKLRGLLEALEGGLLPYETQPDRVRARGRRATL